ncbi:MAG: sialate O-acetylesterase [bacterium]
MGKSRGCAWYVATWLVTGYSAFAQALDMCWIFGSGMVLQAERPVPIWGQAQPGEEVTVRFAGQLQIAKAGSDGEWAVRFAPLVVSAEGREMKVEAKSGTKTFTDVLVGDVWLCSGQSNMAQPSAAQATGGDEESKKQANPLLRSFSVAYNAWASEPYTKNFAWDKKVTNWFDWGVHGTKISAVPYYFGSMLQRETGRPIGLILAPVGASNAEAWVPMKAMEAVPEFAKLVNQSKLWINNLPSARQAFDAEVVAWKSRKQEAEAKGQNVKERKPNDFRAELAPRFWIGAMYNARIAPLRNLALKGVIWYQGENNAAGHGQCTKDGPGYERLMKVLIESWRTQFEQPELPFYQVQLSMFNWDDGNKKRQRDPNEPGSWSVIREAQEKSAKTIPHSGLAVSVDIGDKANIHPPNKRPVGERLAKLALRDVYGKKVIVDGPAYASHEIKNGKVIVRFKNLHGGLKIGKREGIPADTMIGFVIAGEDKTFVWADAKIEGDDVIVWSDKVEKPVAVRYGYIQYHDVNLFNGAGLPAVPFRTDDWPLLTKLETQ